MLFSSVLSFVTEEFIAVLGDPETQVRALLCSGRQKEGRRVNDTDETRPVKKDTSEGSGKHQKKRNKTKLERSWVPVSLSLLICLSHSKICLPFLMDREVQSSEPHDREVKRKNRGISIRPRPQAR